MSQYSLARHEPMMCLEAKPLIDTNCVHIVREDIENNRRKSLLKQLRHQGGGNSGGISLAACRRGSQNIAKHREMGTVREGMCAACRNDAIALVRSEERRVGK